MSRRWLLSLLLCQACGAASVAAPPKAPSRPAPAAQPAPPPAQPAPVVAEPALPPAPAAQTPPLLEAVVEAGDIPRPALLAVLSAGVGRFLQKVRAEPKLEGGRFVGWTLVYLFEPAPAPGTVLLPGDTVLRVNGQSIERPEQFKNVWDSLATESELVLLVERSGQQSQVRFRIVD